MTELDKRHRSSVYDSMVKSPNRAMLRATGMTDESFEKPIVGVISTWAENTPCNIHLHDFGKLAKEGVKDAGAWPVQFRGLYRSGYGGSQRGCLCSYRRL